MATTEDIAGTAAAAADAIVGKKPTARRPKRCCKPHVNGWQRLMAERVEARGCVQRTAKQQESR